MRTGRQVRAVWPRQSAALRRALTPMISTTLHIQRLDVRAIGHVWIVMIVAGFELTRITSTPSARSARLRSRIVNSQACPITIDRSMIRTRRID